MRPCGLSKAYLPFALINLLFCVGLPCRSLKVDPEVMAISQPSSVKKCKQLELCLMTYYGGIYGINMHYC